MNPLDLVLKSLMSGGGAGANSGVLDMSFSNISKNLLKKQGNMEEEDLSSFIRRPKMSDMRGEFSGSSTQYLPGRLYGGAYKALGGRRVRGGLLGD
jgi:hypothetical protein